MADLVTQTRRSRAARALLLALGAAFVIALPAQAAVAAQLPLPPHEGCVTDPLSCVEDIVTVPPLPEVDRCVQNPASCLPAPLPEVDECIAHPASCELPAPVPSVDRCADNPARCLTKPERDDQKDAREDQKDEKGFAVPGGRDDTPHGPREDVTRSSGGTGPVEDEDLASPSEAPATAVAAAPVASTDVVGSIGQGVTDAARRFAFPLALAGFAAIFLLVQGRIDRRDPKLAAAPLDSRDDVVLFR
jgi:hypothetical protein